MPSLLPGGIDLEAALDHDDCIRRVLSEFVTPQSLEGLQSRFESYTNSGMRTVLPSGKPYTRCDAAGIVKDSVDAGFLHALIGSSWKAIAEHTDSLAGTLSHSFPLEEGGRHNRVLDWADSQVDDAKNPIPFPKDQTFYALTHAGFEALTGHAQGERPEPPEEDPVDPAEISPAKIGDA